MNKKLISPKEAASILKVKQNTIYDMIKKNRLPATKVGKQFRIWESDVYALLDPAPPSSTPALEDTITTIDQDVKTTDAANSSNNIIVCGQDLIIDMLSSAVNQRIQGTQFIRSYQGSYNGLYSMYKRNVTVATTHLWDMETDTYNIPFIKSLLPGEEVCLYHIVDRPVGIYVQKGNPKKITGIEDLARDDVSMVNRERGSGIRVLTDSLIKSARIKPESVNGYSRTVNSHLAAAALISKGGADCAWGTKGIAAQIPNIDFIFIKNEKYDLAVRKSDLDRPEIDQMIKIIQSNEFKEQVSALQAYDVTDMGKRIY